MASGPSAWLYQRTGPAGLVAGTANVELTAGVLAVGAAATGRIRSRGSRRRRRMGNLEGARYRSGRFMLAAVPSSGTKEHGRSAKAGNSVRYRSGLLIADQTTKSPHRGGERNK